MHNPYTIWTPAILGAMLKQPMYFVRQSYPRGKFLYDEGVVTLLLTHYPRHETDRERAERHMRLLWKDPYRFLYDSTCHNHLERLAAAASQPAGYRVYINLLPKKWEATPMMKIKIGQYIREKFPWWNYSPQDKLNVTLKERYGHLFLLLLWRGQQTEVLLEDIENFSPCAMT